MRWLTLLVTGCGWGNLPGNSGESLFVPLWDPLGAVPTEDGLYVPLPYAGAAVLIRDGGEWERLDIGEGRLTRLFPAPDDRTLIAFVERYFCDPDDPREARQVQVPEDCSSEDLTTETEISLVTNGAVGDPISVAGAYNQVAFSEDGKFAVVFIDFTQGIEIDGPLNLTGVVVVNLATQVSQVVPVNFASDRVLFVEDESGAATEAVVVSRNNVSLVDLASDPPRLDVTFPLTLDVDSVVDPVGIELTPDGRYALLSAQGDSDLYVLDLEQHAINIVELAGAPTAMAVSPADRTVLVYGGIAKAQTVEHALFETETFTLDEPMNDVTAFGESQAILWSHATNRTAHDLYRLDVLSGDLVEYRLQNPAVSLSIAPTREFAVVFTRAESGFGGQDVDSVYDANPGMEIVNLQTDDSVPFILESDGIGVAFRADETRLDALVLQQGVEGLFSLSLYTGQATEIETSAPPVAIGTMPDGRFFVTHDRALGLVSFVDANGEVTEVGGFAATGVLDPIELVEEEP